MTVRMAGRILIGSIALAALVGCEEGEFGALLEGGATTPDQTAQTEQTDTPARGVVTVVEAPEIFDVSDQALWDGRPSLGLIWVAYEGADPTNVMIRNEDNGRFVVGALYRRERFFPGPAFQLSSDAAAELGVLAGNPTNIRVTALKEEITVPPTPVVEETPIEEPAVEEVPADISVSEDGEVASAAEDDASISLDPIAAAAAAAIEAADPVAADIGEIVETAPAEEPTIADPIISEVRPTTEGPNAPSPRKNVIPEPAAVAALAPLEPISVTPEVAIATPAQGVTTLERPFIQVGIFSISDNAQRTAQGISDSGVVPFVEEQRVGGRIFYRVVVGPASNVEERSALLEKVRALGFADAYFVKN